MALRIDLVEITGVFRDSDPPAQVQNNVWVIGDDDEVDRRRRLARRLTDRRGRRRTACHAHPVLARSLRPRERRSGAPGTVDAPDRPAPRRSDAVDEAYPDVAPDLEVVAGDMLMIAGSDLKVMHTPGHTPVACACTTPAVTCSAATRCSRVDRAPRRSATADFDVIIASIREQPAGVAPQTEVHSGTRAVHHDRRRSSASGGMDRSRLLIHRLAVVCDGLGTGWRLGTPVLVAFGVVRLAQRREVGLGDRVHETCSRDGGEFLVIQQVLLDRVGRHVGA